MKYYLGIDIGTSATKGVCFDECANKILSKSIEYPLYTNNLGHAEQDPRDWLNACVSIIKEITSKYKIEGIGLSGQMHGLVLLDKNDNILRNSIIWCDNRTFKEKEEIENVIGKERIKQITGNEAMAPFTLAKLLWVKNNEPDIYNNIAKIMLPKDYIRYALTKEFKTEYSDASGMQILDIFNKVWSKEILDKFDIDINKLPKLIESVEISGYINHEELPNLKDVYIVGGAGDQAASALGNGIVSVNDLSIVLGSSGVVFSPINKEEINSELPVQVFMHAIKDRYHIMGVTNGCGLSYKWYSENFANVNDDNKYESLNNEANSSNPGANGLLYLPYLNGERTPHNDPYASGTFIGIRQGTKKGDFTRAILEGVSYSLREVYELLPKKDYNIYISGGGAKGKLWREIISTNLNTNVLRINQDEGGCLGVAILAMVADGTYKNIDEASKTIITIKDVTSPILKDREIYNKQYKLYKNAYKSLKDFYKLASN